MTETAILVATALQGPISQDEVTMSSFDERVERVARQIYEKDARKRSLKMIIAATRTGKWGEHAIATRLRAQGLPVIENEERLTLEWHWDLQVYETLIEVKYQHPRAPEGPRTCFSVDDLEKVKNAKIKWSSYDLLLAWVPGDNKTVIPWLLMDSRVLSDQEKLFRPSKWKGHFVKTGKAVNAALALQLNTI